MEPSSESMVTQSLDHCFQTEVLHLEVVGDGFGDRRALSVESNSCCIERAKLTLALILGTGSTNKPREPLTAAGGELSILDPSESSCAPR
jgi:hypothetical protein